MRIYVARHGQVATDAQYHDGDYSLPKGEIDLSSLGRQQASLLGAFLKKRGFSGRIYASPLMRTMETAQLTRLVRPDVIIHTGDTTDEDKMGCDAAVREAYLPKAAIPAAGTAGLKMFLFSAAGI